MSIEQMISEHPDVGAGYNPSLGEAVRLMSECAAICNSCADACVAEAMDMHQCIRICMDCADVCAATAMVAMRRTGDNRALIQAQLSTCIAACDICAAECGRHDHAHCRRCAEMCRKCGDACRTALERLEEEVRAEA